MLRGSLNNIRVVDFSQIGAGPTCTMLLGDLGADVIKIESPEGDIGRALGPPWVDDTSAIFVAFNRNKRSIVLDLKTGDGLEAARRLIGGADVIVESFRPGVMDRLGLGYEACRQLRPDVVYCSVSAYGSTGPGASRGGVDGIVQAVSGLMGLIGEDGQAPGKVQAPVVDVTTGHIATIAVLAQLFMRQRTGEGGFIDVSMLAAAVGLQQSSLTTFLADGLQPSRTGSAAPYSAPNEAFSTADGWIMVAAYQGGRWERLCALLQREDLMSDPRFATSGQRLIHRSAMRDELSAIFRTLDCAHWLTALESADILCAKVATYDDLMRNDLFKHLGMIVEVQDKKGGVVRFPGFPINCHENRVMPHKPPPGHGEHSAEILLELGYSSVEAAQLANRGVRREGKQSVPDNKEG